MVKYTTDKVGIEGNIYTNGCSQLPQSSSSRTTNGGSNSCSSCNDKDLEIEACKMMILKQVDVSDGLKHELDIRRQNEQLYLDRIAALERGSRRTGASSASSPLFGYTVRATTPTNHQINGKSGFKRAVYPAKPPTSVSGKRRRRNDSSSESWNSAQGNSSTLFLKKKVAKKQIFKCNSRMSSPAVSGADGVREKKKPEPYYLFTYKTLASQSSATTTVPPIPSVTTSPKPKRKALRSSSVGMVFSDTPGPSDRDDCLLVPDYVKLPPVKPLNDLEVYDEIISDELFIKRHGREEDREKRAIKRDIQQQKEEKKRREMESSPSYSMYCRSSSQNEYVRDKLHSNNVMPGWPDGFELNALRIGQLPKSMRCVVVDIPVMK